MAIFMWDRGILKSNAKLALINRYWLAFAVTLVAWLLGGGFSQIRSRLDIDLDFGDFSHSFQSFSKSLGHHASGVVDFLRSPMFQIALGWLGILSLIGFLFSIAFLVFVGIPVSVGKCRYFIHNRLGGSRFGTLFSAFSSGYLHTVGVVYSTDLLVMLWLLPFFLMLAVGGGFVRSLSGAVFGSLLMLLSLGFLAPLIIKLYQYSLVRYLISDNPALTGSRARELSRMLTDGEKGNLFVLQLSFLGWFLLGALCLGVGTLFVLPYHEATMAELYIFLRDRAVRSKMIRPAELNLLPPARHHPRQTPPRTMSFR